MKRSGIPWATLALLACLAGNAAADDGRWKVVKPGVMVDTFTELQWTQRDNLGGDVNWNQAKAHCAGLALDGGGWGLPTMTELSQVYSGAQGEISCGNYKCRAPKGFYLTGLLFWSNEREGSSEAWSFYLSHGVRDSYAVSSAPLFSRALCVRRA